MPGSIRSAVTDTVRDAEVTCATLEFGTLPLKKVFRALQAENWLHHHGGADHPRAAAIKEALLRAFYPSARAWREDVLAQGKVVVDQAVDAVACRGDASG